MLTELVDRVEYSVHTKVDSPNSMRITYVCRHNRYYEYLPLENRSARLIAARKWYPMTSLPMPMTAEQGAKTGVAGYLREPYMINVSDDGDYKRVDVVLFDEARRSVREFDLAEVMAIELVDKNGTSDKPYPGVKVEVGQNGQWIV